MWGRGLSAIFYRYFNLSVPLLALDHQRKIQST